MSNRSAAACASMGCIRFWPGQRLIAVGGDAFEVLSLPFTIRLSMVSWSTGLPRISHPVVGRRGPTPGLPTQVSSKAMLAPGLRPHVSASASSCPLIPCRQKAVRTPSAFVVRHRQASSRNELLTSAFQRFLDKGGHAAYHLSVEIGHAVGVIPTDVEPDESLPISRLPARMMTATSDLTERGLVRTFERRADRCGASRSRTPSVESTSSARPGSGARQHARGRCAIRGWCARQVQLFLSQPHS
jgi:hypothetical protein